MICPGCGAEVKDGICENECGFVDDYEDEELEI
jgi:hypothetical protein